MKRFIKPFLSTLMIMVVLLLYVLTIRGISGAPVTSDIKNNLDQAARPLELSPERGRYALIMSLMTRGRFDLDSELAEAVYPDVGWYDGRFYILFAPGISLMAIPLYLIGLQLGIPQVASFFLSSLFATLCAVVIYKISRNIFSLPNWLSLFASLSYCFGSISWVYAVSLYQHQATTFFILSGIYAVWKYGQKTRHSWMYSAYVWLIYALSISIDTPNALLFAPVILYMALTSISLTNVKNRWELKLRLTAAFTSLIFVVGMLLHGYYNMINFGGWTKLSGGLIDYKTIKERNLLSTTSGQTEIEKIESNINPAKFFSEEDFPFGLYTQTVSGDRGLILYSPLFVLGLLGIIGYIKRLTLVTGIMVTNVLVVLFLYSSWGDPWGGWAYGPRYMISVMGLLSPFLASWIYASRGRISLFLKKSIALVLFIYSSAVALLGALTTSTIPPKIEADFLHMQHNFIRNIPFLLDSKANSYVYNTFLSQHINLLQYYVLIAGSVILLAYFILFVIPAFSKNDS